MGIANSEVAKVLSPEIFTSEHWKLVGKDLLKILDKAAAQFAQNNLPIAIGLSETEVQGILFNAVMEIPRVIPVPPNASDEELVIVSRVNKARASAYALAMDAQAARNEQTALLEANAKAFAVEVGKTLVSVAISGLATSAVNAAVGAAVK